MTTVDTDHVSYNTTTDFYNGTYTTHSTIGTLSSSAAYEWKEQNVLAAVQDDVANARTRSQFKLYFPVQTDNDGLQDSAWFYSGGSATNKPELVLKYQ